MLTKEQVEKFRRCCISDDTLLRYKHAEMQNAEEICDLALQALASLQSRDVRAATIEECARVCEDAHQKWFIHPEGKDLDRGWKVAINNEQQRLAAAIRALPHGAEGQTKAVPQVPVSVSAGTTRKTAEVDIRCQPDEKGPRSDTTEGREPCVDRSATDDSAGGITPAAQPPASPGERGGVVERVERSVPEPIVQARADAYMDNQPIYNAALAAAGAIATHLRKKGQRICDCGMAPQGLCCCATAAPQEQGGGR